MDNKKEKIIISVTTIPSRLNNIIPVLDSIKNQTIISDEIVLVLPLKSLREQINPDIDPYNISENINNYIKLNNITLMRPDYDLGPIMKLLPVLLREKKNKTDNIIISIDDDKKYFSNTIEDLINGYQRNNCVCARKGAILNFYDDNIKNRIIANINIANINIANINIKEKPMRSADFTEDQKINFIYGTGGVLYKPSFFKDDIFEELDNLYKSHKEGLYVDDAVISVFLMKNDIKMILVKSEKNEFQKKT